MSTPPFLLGFAALLWASQAGGLMHWAIALVAAALLEGPRLTARRWKLSGEDFNRVSDFCVVLSIALGAYLYFTFGNPRAVTLLFQWLPVLMLALAVTQAWSTSSAVDLSVLFWALRREKLTRPMTLDLAWPCFALWMLGASAANAQSIARLVFFAGLVLLCGWAMAARRPRSFPAAAWAGLVLGAAALGYAGQWGMHALQGWLEGAIPEWLAGSGTRTDPYRSATDIGSIGELKSSDAIVLRVDREAAARAPLLLHRASYDEYAGRVWLARSARFEGVPPESRGAWTLNGNQPSLRVTIHDYSPAGNPVLSLPAGTSRLEKLPALGLRQNTLGAVQAEMPPGYFSFEALSDPDASAEGAPGDLDVRLPAAEAAVLRRVASEWRLAENGEEEALSRLRARLADGFTYSLFSKATPIGATPLSEFLLTSRTGHCEYFASATVLLLRAAGIPARYATGYSVQEFSGLENAWIVRERHAHSWARAWIGGRWIDVDTTPAQWAGVEAAQSSAWVPLRDLASWARFALSRLFGHLDDENVQQWGIALAFALIAFVAWRVLRRRQSSVGLRHDKATPRAPSPGADSPFYEVETVLATLGWQRAPGQALGRWLAGIDAPEPDLLRRLGVLHYRYRFDPLGLDGASRSELEREASEWLRRHAPKR